VSGSAGRDHLIDCVKAIACILVALGHLFQGLIQAGILVNNGFLLWFDFTVYTFHVPLFFICSGYLYQKTARFRGIFGWGKNVINKLVSLGIPFTVYSAMVYLMKLAFSSQVNAPVDYSFFSIFIKPQAPFWFLYTLFFIYLITIPARSDRHMAILFMLAAAAKLCYIFMDISAFPYLLERLMNYEIWFVSGMALCQWRFKLVRSPRRIVIMSGVFLPLSILFVVFRFTSFGWGFVVGALACVFVFSALSRLPLTKGEKLLRFAAKYNMPVFLMHTIFAAGIRSALLLAGMGAPGIHIAAGIAASFAGPVFVGLICEKIKLLNYTMYPPKIFR
jgi:fucose 4-O-acetylase-like acetyltransferase